MSALPPLHRFHHLKLNLFISMAISFRGVVPLTAISAE
jgi:hypothetical protein